MSKICVVYYSGYGHTAKLAQSILAGARQVSTQVQECRIDAEG